MRLVALTDVRHTVRLGVRVQGACEPCGMNDVVKTTELPLSAAGEHTDLRSACVLTLTRTSR